MKIFIGSDHNGFALKRKLIDYLVRAGYEVEDDGDEMPEPEDDFPIFTERVVNQLLANGLEAKGILICASGQGMCMAANRHKGIRASLGYDRESVRAARNDDDANILCLPAKVLEADAAYILVETFLNTPFAKALRFKRRIAQMDET